MYKKTLGLCCFLFTNILMASDLYTPQFVLSNKTHGLTIKFPSPGLDTGMPIGPTDATVIDNTFVVLDTYGSGVSFFDTKGTLLKRVSLPENIQFQNIVRDRDNSLFVFGTDAEQTIVVHIQNYEVTEQAIYKTTNNYIDTIIPDDYGLVMNRMEDHFDRQKYADASPEDSDKVLEESTIEFLDRINRNCMSCEPKSVDGIQVGGLFYRISPEKNSSLLIEKKEVPLVFYTKDMRSSNELIQVDQNGIAWVKNTIDLDGALVTYVWKVSKDGEIVSIYRFASDEERKSTEWLMKHGVIVSNDGKVYGLLSNKKQFKLILLKPFSFKEMKFLAKNLDSLLLKKNEIKSKNTKEITKNIQSVEITTGGCRTGQKAINDAVAYVNNTAHLSSTAIKNDSTCPKRIIPPYLIEGTVQTYNSVSYNWGGFDTVAEFNRKILTNKMKAGNVNSKNSPLLSCTAGVDCSGLISRAWGLTAKLGTHDIASNKITEETSWYDLKAADVFIIPGNHVYLFQRKSKFGKIAVVVDANAEYGAVVQHEVPVEWLREKGFNPRRPKSNIVCTK